MNTYVWRNVGLWGCLGLAFALGAPAAGDTITAGGARYKDVLVLKSNSSFYIQIPWEGRTISVRLEDVDQSTVVINNDPYYRDRLKEEYRVSKQLRDAGQLPQGTDASAFRVLESSNGNFELPADSGSGTGAGKGGLGIPRTQVEQALTSFGVQFLPGPGRGGDPSVAGTMPNGARIELIGPPESLNGLDITASIPAGQMVAFAGQMKMFVLQMDSSLAGDYDAMIREAQSSGRSSRTVNGISVSITMAENGGTVDFRMAVTAGK